MTTHSNKDICPAHLNIQSTQYYYLRALGPEQARVVPRVTNQNLNVNVKLEDILEMFVLICGKVQDLKMVMLMLVKCVNFIAS